MSFFGSKETMARLRFEIKSHVAETPKAMLFKVERKTIWIPRSLMAKLNSDGHYLRFEIPENIAKKNEWEKYYDPDWVEDRSV